MTKSNQINNAEYVFSRELPYIKDVSSLFEKFCGTMKTDTVLLESADISSKTGVMSVAILRSSLRITCSNQKVQVRSLTTSGNDFLTHLKEQLADYVTDHKVLVENREEVTFTFSPSTLTDERERLRAISNIEVLRVLQHEPALVDKEQRFPFLAGGFAFDYLETFEHLPQVTEGENPYPDYQFVQAEVLLRSDHQNQKTFIHGIVSNEEEARLLDTYFNEITNAIEHIFDFDFNDDFYGRKDEDNTLVATALVNDEEFSSRVRKLKEHIHAGDIYQVVPSRVFSIQCDNAFSAYKRLRDTNPSPYMFYLRSKISDKTVELFGASPESSLKYTESNRQVELYPIAGTAPRGLNDDGTVNDELDIRNELSLRTDQKEIAEHIMLVDLARNDLARVAEPTTRKVTELLQVDRYSRVMHLISKVVATLAKDLDALDAYRACMNMGTLTGAPKIRATELIREVEKTRRGSYGGAVGYLSANKDVDTCIVIRSALVVDGTAIVQAGAGVIRDSVEQKEADETVHKAYAVLAAIAQSANCKLEIKR